MVRGSSVLREQARFSRKNAQIVIRASISQHVTACCDSHFMTGLGISLLRPHRFHIGAGLCCLLLLAASTGLYAYITGPLLQLIVTGGTKGAAYFLPFIPSPNPFRQSSSSMSLTLVALLLVGVALVKGLAHLGQAVLLEGTAQRIGFQLRVKLYGHLMRLPLAVHREQSLGDVLTRLLDDIRRVQEATVMAPLIIIRESLGAAALLAVAIWMAPWLSLVACGVLPMVGLVTGVLSQRIKRAAGQGQHDLGRLTARATQGLGALREVKSCGAEEREIHAVEDHGQQALQWSLRHILTQAIAPLLNEVMAAIALGGTLVYAGSQVARGSLPAERFVSFFAAVLLLYRPIKEISKAAHLLATGQASVERVAFLMQLPGEDLLAEEPGQGAGLGALRQQLELRDVSFSYGPGKWTIKSFHLLLPVGRIVALAGPSGTGKTTLANLVCGLERPQRGKLLWDGLDLAQRPLKELRDQVALVPQQPLLFDGTLAENIRYGAPQASEAALRQAAEGAGLKSFIQGLAHGYNTFLGPGGVHLSVGEAQRLALARALLRQVNVLILDEPSSALDADNEAHLIQTLRALGRTKAILVIAHSPALLRAADEVITCDGAQFGLSAATK